MRKNLPALFAMSTFLAAGTVAGAQTPSPNGEFLYLLNSTANGNNPSFNAYRIDQETGFLSPVPGQPFRFNIGAPPRECFCSAIPFADPQGRFLFYNFSWIPNTGYGSMRVNAATGALTNDDLLLLPNGIASAFPSTDPLGRFIFGNLDSNGGPNNWLQSFAVSPEGHLKPAPGEPFAFPGTNTFGPPVADANYVYVPNYDTNYPNPSYFYGFTINGASGALMQSSTTNDGIEPSNQVITPNGKFIYSDQSYSGNVGVDVEIVGYKVNADGSLTQLDQAPQQTPDFPAEGLTISPNGKFLYHVAPNDIRVYAIDPNTGYLTLTVVYSNYNPSGGTLVIDPAVKFAYLPQVTSPSPTTSYSLVGFTVDPDTGRLAPIPGNETTLGNFPQNITIVRPR